MAKRKQPAALRKYWAARRGTKSHAMTHSPRSVPARRRSKSRAPAKRHRRSRRHHSSGVTLTKLAMAGAAMGFLFSKPETGSMRETVINTVNKVPGAKTFGPAAVAGAIALGVDHFVYKSAWLRAAGYIGVALAALTLGAQNTEFKWLGDDEGNDNYVADVD